MPKGSTVANDFLKLILQAVNIALLADNTVTTPLTSLYLALHTADPGVGGSQATSEASYTGYGRIAITRASGAGGWTVVGAVGSNTSLAQFAQSSSSETETYVSIGTATSGAGKILWSGALNAPLAVANLIQPQFGAGALTITES